MESVAEIRREKVFIPAEMSTQQIKQQYGFSSERSRRVKQQGFFVRNYGRKQIIIDPENFDPAVSYSTAKRVYFKNFSWSSVAKSIKDDLIQEAVTRMYELSGKVREGANEKYGIGYGYFWVAQNAMLSYLKSWERHTKGRLLGDITDDKVAAKIYHLTKDMEFSQ